MLILLTLRNTRRTRADYINIIFYWSDCWLTLDTPRCIMQYITRTSWPRTDIYILYFLATYSVLVRVCYALYNQARFFSSITAILGFGVRKWASLPVSEISSTFAEGNVTMWATIYFRRKKKLLLCRSRMFTLSHATLNLITWMFTSV